MLDSLHSHGYHGLPPIAFHCLLLHLNCHLFLIRVMGIAQPVVICHRVDTHTHKRMHEISAVPYQPNVYVLE